MLEKKDVNRCLNCSKNEIMKACVQRGNVVLMMCAGCTYSRDVLQSIVDADLSDAAFPFSTHKVRFVSRLSVVLSETSDRPIHTSPLFLLQTHLLGGDVPQQQLHGLGVHYYRATRMHIVRTMPWQYVSPSVCLSHAGIESKRLYISSTFFSPSGSPTILVFPYQTGWLYSDGDPPSGGVECKGGMKKSRFSTNIGLYLGTHAIQSHSYYGRRIGNRTQTFEQYQFERP